MKEQQPNIAARMPASTSTLRSRLRAESSRKETNFSVDSIEYAIASRAPSVEPTSCAYDSSSISTSSCSSRSSSSPSAPPPDSNDALRPTCPSEPAGKGVCGGGVCTGGAGENLAKVSSVALRRNAVCGGAGATPRAALCSRERYIRAMSSSSSRQASMARSSACAVRESSRTSCFSSRTASSCLDPATTREPTTVRRNSSSAHRTRAPSPSCRLCRSEHAIMRTASSAANSKGGGAPLSVPKPPVVTLESGGGAYGGGVPAARAGAIGPPSWRAGWGLCSAEGGSERAAPPLSPAREPCSTRRRLRCTSCSIESAPSGTIK
mmetsp:Transcript_11644/g.37174  ORF Transcript_11644/g.37174 Transcript_11644/m.37174 type:complete len:322 (-) Transcript_11644:484-1449(-)